MYEESDRLMDSLSLRCRSNGTTFCSESSLKQVIVQSSGSFLADKALMNRVHAVNVSSLSADKQ